MIFVQKLPTLDPVIRDALRSHIIRKRQRLKQELEQDAIEKRLKREKELKQFQDAMTLDQIKEQLYALEIKLESLKDEKHNLFIELKQVLNEDDSRRKQTESSHNKQLEMTGSSTQNMDGDEGLSANMNSTSATNSLKRFNISSINSPLPKVDSNPAQQIRPIPTKNTPPINQPINATGPNQPTYAVDNSSYFGLPLSHVPPIYPSQSNLHMQNFGMKLMHPESDDPSSRTPLLSGPMRELIPPTTLNFGSRQRIQGPHLINRPFLMDIPLSLDANQKSSKKVIAGGKRSLSVANLNDSIDERCPMRKGSNNFIYQNSNQFMLDSIHPNGIPNLSHYNPTNHGSSNLPISSIGVPVPTSSTSLLQQNVPGKQLSHQTPNFDYMISAGKPGIMVTGLNSIYPTHPSLIPQTALYPGIDADSKHYTSPYFSLAQQYSNTSRHNNLPLIQAEHNPHPLMANNFTYNASRKQPHSKNYFSHNK